MGVECTEWIERDCTTDLAYTPATKSKVTVGQQDRLIESTVKYTLNDIRKKLIFTIPSLNSQIGVKSVTSCTQAAQQSLDVGE